MRQLNLSFLASLVLLTAMVPMAMAQVTVTGTFQYEDREWDINGYTGIGTNLPIRYADVEIVNAGTQAIFATGSTDASGFFSINANIPNGTNVYARCLSATNNSSTYHIQVVDTFVRTGGTVSLAGSTIHAITSATQNYAGGGSLAFGSNTITDPTGSGVAQAFNILDMGVKCFDYLATPEAINRYPFPSEFVVFGWDGTTGSTGSNYFWQGIFIAATPTDTDGWSDAVILHEAGHWANDMFTADDNPGGSHFIGDNFQDPRLSYGEGYATYFKGQVEEFHGEPNTATYADLSIPAPLPAAGNLEFAYDFETGNFSGGTPIGQIGSANETNVTSAMWDVQDGTGTSDASPGVDDDISDDDGTLSWAVLSGHMVTQDPIDWITVEDFYEGWFIEHGAGFMQAEIDDAMITNQGMPFFQDAQEPDDTIGTATTAACFTYNVSGGGGLVINECDMGAEDKIEIMNNGTTPIDMTGYVIRTYRNGFSASVYTFPSFTLGPGGFVVVHESGDPINNNDRHLFGGGGFSVVWFNGDDGACVLENAGGTALDFVRWDNVSGSDPNTTPTPAGQTFTGTLFSSLAGLNLSRDEDGTDTDDASDFSSLGATMGAPNFTTSTAYTIYPAGDADVICLPLLAGDLVVIQASAAHSAGQPLLELLNSSGGVAGSATQSFGINSLAELQFLTSVDTTMYCRIKNDAPYTNLTPLDVIVYKRPVNTILAAPVALVADPENLVDVSDQVDITWFNGAAYDNVELLRDGFLIATLGGSATSYTDNVNRGLYTYEVRGVLGGATTSTASGRAFAGTINCNTEEEFESGTANLVLEGSWGLTSSIASVGTFSGHDSPSGDYANNLNISLEVVEPADLLSAATLTFDHICITEATFDFGYVEISTDFGSNWATLASYDMDDHAGWNDGVANPGDWISESLDISSYIGEVVRIRFRLETDAFVTEDGWYVDNIALSDSTCNATSSVPGDGLVPTMLRAAPNPFSGPLMLTLNLPEVTTGDIQVFNAAGRLVRTLHRGELLPGTSFVWDGANDNGRSTASGLYFIRAATKKGSLVRRVVKVD